MRAPAGPPELSARDRAILRDLYRVRLLTGRQVERLHFAELASPNVRGSARRRSLGRLVALGLVTTLPRRVGGERAGSAGLVYALDARAHRLWPLWLDADVAGSNGRKRRPWVIGWPFAQHTLDVAELYVRLRERERTGRIQLISFAAEPASWHPSSVGVLKPDAYAAWLANGWEQHRWIEVDRATECLPTMRRKLLAYVHAAHSGDVGPGGVLPKVTVTAPTSRRQQALDEVIAGLPPPGEELIEVVQFAELFSDSATLPAARPPPR